MSDVASRLTELREQLPEGIQLVAVSKFQPVELIREAYEAGQRLFGESRVQELLQKIPLMPEDIKWHFIGHLQTNKVRQLVGNVALIESIDSERLLEVVNTESLKKGVVSNVLMQVHVAKEETKFGFSPEELLSFFRDGRHEGLGNIRICGLMAMASNTDDMKRVRDDFAEAASLFRTVKESVSGLDDFEILSMGMSGDWPIAVEEGANLVRVGSRIFGERHY